MCSPEIPYRGYLLIQTRLYSIPTSTTGMFKNIFDEPFKIIETRHFFAVNVINCNRGQDFKSNN